MNHPHPSLYPYRYLHLYRYQVLIEKGQPNEVVARQLERASPCFDAAASPANGTRSDGMRERAGSRGQRFDAPPAAHPLDWTPESATELATEHPL